MLSKQESAVMSALYPLCNAVPTRLLSASDLKNRLPEHSDVAEDSLAKILFSLKAQDYLDVLLSDRKGETVFVISLTVKGMNFPQERRKEKLQIYLRIALSVGGAFLSFLIGILLKRIFS